MTTAGDIYSFLDEIAPFRTALSFDNAGFLAGDEQTAVTEALLALDITAEVIGEAASYGAQLLISHHPVIFTPLRRLERGSAVWLLAEKGICAISAHTNLDMAANGVNMCLCERLGLQNIRALAVIPENGCAQCLTGELPRPCAPAEFAKTVKELLGVGGVRYCEGAQPIRTVGVCAGAGAEFFPVAAQNGAQAFVTAEVKHHQWLEAKERRITLVDAGHFSTENPVMDSLCATLQKEFPEVCFRRSELQKDPVHYI